MQQFVCWAKVRRKELWLERGSCLDSVFSDCPPNAPDFPTPVPLSTYCSSFLIFLSTHSSPRVWFRFHLLLSTLSNSPGKTPWLARLGSQGALFGHLFFPITGSFRRGWAAQRRHRPRVPHTRCPDKNLGHSACSMRVCSVTTRPWRTTGEKWQCSHPKKGNNTHLLLPLGHEITSQSTLSFLE